MIFSLFRRKSQRLPDNDGVLITNGLKYRKKLQSAITQIHRTKKFVQKNLDSSESEIHGNDDLFIIDFMIKFYNYCSGKTHQ